MPLYEYECSTCQARFERLVRRACVASEDALTPCPKCAADSVTRVISPCAVSSDATREASFKRAKQANAKILRDKAIADAEQVRHHQDHD